MSKKSKPQKMGLHDFLGPDTRAVLPSESSGLEAPKGKGKGGDRYQNRGDNQDNADWRGADRGDRPRREASDNNGRSDTGDWFQKTEMRSSRDGDRDDTRSGFNRQNTERSGGDDNWRRGPAPGSDRVQEEREAPQARKRLQLKPRTVDIKSDDAVASQPRELKKSESLNPFGSAKPVDIDEKLRAAKSVELAPEKPKPVARENAWRGRHQSGDEPNPSPAPRPVPEKAPVEKVEPKPSQEEPIVEEEEEDGWTTVKKPAKKPWGAATATPTTTSTSARPHTRAPWNKEEEPSDRKPAWKDNAREEKSDWRDNPREEKAKPIEERSSAWGRPSPKREEASPKQEPAEKRPEQAQPEKEEIKAPSASKGIYVHPSAKKKMEDEAKQKQDAEKEKADEEERARREAAFRDPPRQERSERPERSERLERPERQERPERTTDRSRTSTSLGGGKYVPPGQRNRPGDDFSTGKEQRTPAISREKQMEMEKIRKEEARIRREEEEQERIEREAQFRMEKEKEIELRKQKRLGITDFDVELLQKFASEVEELQQADDIKEFADNVDSFLPAKELESSAYVGKVYAFLLEKVRSSDEETIQKVVNEWKPLIACLLKLSQVHRFKLKSLFECQKAISNMQLPRLSPSTALIEAFFDSLYWAEIIEEEYFHMWANDQKDSTENKEKALFQLTPWLEWLKYAKIEGEETTDEEGSDSDNESDEEDIEANVPKSRAMLPQRRV